MKNFEVFLKDPRGFDLVNNGVSKVAEVGDDAGKLQTLRFELETFVCDGEYGRGLERMLGAYLSGLGKPEQQAAWVSGFFGSGKSHLVKMLRYLWVDFRFPDGASARSIAHLPASVKDLLVELTNRAKPCGGLQAAAGTLGAGNMDNVRMAFLQLVFRAKGLPESLAGAKFVIWLHEKQLFDPVTKYLKGRKLDPERELRNFQVSPHVAEALVAAVASYGSPQNAQAAMRSQFPTGTSPTMEETLDLIRSIFGAGGDLPCTLLVIDEIQQFIGDKLQRAMDVQEIAEHCCRDLRSRLLLVGTGQSALTGTASLSRLQARFTVKVPLSDTDVENVIRKTVLMKKPERVGDIGKMIDDHQGEISRHLQSTRLAATAADHDAYAADYPLLPTRRRFWERVLRNVDASGTTAQLRTQLRIVFDAARESADKDLGHVAPADFIYDQVASDLLNTGVLQREYHEIIMGLRDSTPAGLLKSRLCALVFLVGQLPRTPGADDGVRATAETLADLLVSDLRKEGDSLRQQIPKLLDELVAQGKVMQVGNEYCLQTREGANWNHDFNSRRTRVLNDEARLSTAREEMLAKAAELALRSLQVVHGSSRQSRELAMELTAARPQQPAQKLALWMRHGWAEQEKAVTGDARAAGAENPMLFGFLPRVAHDDMRNGLASMLAAQETLDAHGPPTTPEAIQACNAIKTQLQTAEQNVEACIRQILAGAKVFLGGGSEANGLELVDKVKDAAGSALQRLFPQFADADHANWPQVLSGARAGSVGAMQAVGYQGETVRHPVCKAVYDSVGAGKKGKDVREQFRGAPFGWPQDAVDASLVILTLAGNLRVTVNGQPADARTLTQTQISTASFYQDVPPLTVMQRLDLKALFQKLGVTTANGKESEAATAFLGRALALVEAAGGEAPRPVGPPLKPIQDLQSFSGNAQLVAIHQQKDALATEVAAWTKARDGIAKRLPRWQRLQELLGHAADLPEAAPMAASAAAVESSRGILTDPDPVPPLVSAMTSVLRGALNGVQAELESRFGKEQAKLGQHPLWQELPPEQRQQIAGQCSIEAPTGIKVGSDEEILATLAAGSLANRRTLADALPQRFQRAIEEATRLLEPKATRVSLPSATIRSEEELDAWLAQARDLVATRLKDGPVVV